MTNTSMTTIISKLESLHIFSSIYEIRLLAALMTSVTPKTASELSEELDIPDSKVYPSLNFLNQEGLVSIDDTERPKMYYFDKPEYLNSYLKDLVETRFKKQTEKVGELNQLCKQFWEPEEFLLDNVARLYRGQSIRDELARHLKLTKSHLFLFVSTKFSDYYDILMDYLPRISHDNFRLELVVPTGKSQFLTHLENNVQGKIKLKTSIWNQNSYIIRDHKVMMNIFHSEEDVVLLTNDELMVKNVVECWNDPECCTSTDLVDLQLPEDFQFSTIHIV